TVILIGDAIREYSRSERCEINGEWSAGCSIDRCDDLRRCRGAQTGRNDEVNLRGIAEKHLRGKAVEGHGHRLACKLRTAERRDGSRRQWPRCKCRRIHCALN